MRQRTAFWCPVLVSHWLWTSQRKGYIPVKMALIRPKVILQKMATTAPQGVQEMGTPHATEDPNVTPTTLLYCHAVPRLPSKKFLTIFRYPALVTAAKKHKSLAKLRDLKQERSCTLLMIVHLGQGTMREAHLGSWQHQAGGLKGRPASKKAQSDGWPMRAGCQ